MDTAVVTVGQVTEVDKDSFWPIVEAAGEKTVVLDMYTQWYDSATRASVSALLTLCETLRLVSVGEISRS